MMAVFQWNSLQANGRHHGIRRILGCWLQYGVSRWLLAGTGQRCWWQTPAWPRTLPLWHPGSCWLREFFSFLSLLIQQNIWCTRVFYQLFYDKIFNCFKPYEWGFDSLWLEVLSIYSDCTWSDSEGFYKSCTLSDSEGFYKSIVLYIV